MALFWGPAGGSSWAYGAVRGCEGLMLRRRARARCAALMGRAAATWVLALVCYFCCTLRVDDAQFQRERPLVSQDLGEGTTEPPKPVVADLSGVAQTGFFRMEECSPGRLRLVSLQAR